MPNILGKYNDLNVPDKGMVALSQGLAGYFTYLNKINMRRYLYESSFYLEIIRILSSRGWSVEQEKRVKIRKPEKSANEKSIHSIDGKEIDFIAKKKSHRIVIEFKYLKKKSISMVNGKKKMNSIGLDNLENDYLKINHCDDRFFSQNESVTGYYMILGVKSLIMKAFKEKKCDDNWFLDMKKRVEIIMDGVDNVFFDIGWRVDEIGEEGERFTILILRYGHKS